MALPPKVQVGVWNSDLERIVQSRINWILDKTSINECDKGEFRQIMMLACYDLVVSGKWDGSTISYLHQTAYWTMRKEMTRLGERPLPIGEMEQDFGSVKDATPVLNYSHPEPFEEMEELSDEMVDILNYLDAKIKGRVLKAVLKEIIQSNQQQSEIAENVGVSRARVWAVLEGLRRLTEKDPVLRKLVKKLAKKHGI